MINEIQERLGERAALLQFLRGDIYQVGESLVSIPPIAFVVLENVLSDLYYRGQKDFEALSRWMCQIMVKGGIILTLDSKLTAFSDDVEQLIRTFWQVIKASANFTTLLELLAFELEVDTVEKRNSSLVRQVISTELAKLDVVDQALQEGLAYLKRDQSHHQVELLRRWLGTHES